MCFVICQTKFVLGQVGSSENRAIYSIAFFLALRLYRTFGDGNDGLKIIQIRLESLKMDIFGNHLVNFS